MSQRQVLAKQISSFLPAESVDQVARWIEEYKIILTITPQRASVLGDYHRPDYRKGHRISVNGDLNRYAFLITFVHEMAHLTAWIKFRDTVTPHGKEWKKEFRLLMDEFAGKKIFPAGVKEALKKHLINPAYTHCEDPELMLALAKYNADQLTHLESIPENSLFMWNGRRLFRKGEKLRKRIKCYEVRTNRIYLFNALAEVKMILEKSQDNA